VDRTTRDVATTSPIRSAELVVDTDSAMQKVRFRQRIRVWFG